MLADTAINQRTWAIAYPVGSSIAATPCGKSISVSAFAQTDHEHRTILWTPLRTTSLPPRKTGSHLALCSPRKLAGSSPEVSTEPQHRQPIDGGGSLFIASLGGQSNPRHPTTKFGCSVPSSCTCSLKQVFCSLYSVPLLDDRRLS